MKKFGNLIETIEFYSLLATAERVFGPYDKGDSGRKIVIVIDDEGNRRTISWPKYIMEQHMGRPLDSNTETVDHWDTDKDNNSIENLRIVPRDEHSADDTRRVKLLDLTCPQCGKKFQRSPRLVRDKAKKGRVGLFCSRQCAGKYSRDVQLCLRERLPVPEPPKSEYYKRKYMAKIESIANSMIEKYGQDLSVNL